MGELLDREFQRELLNDLKQLYPRSADLQRSYGEQDDNRLLVNLWYLNEHGLIDLNATRLASGGIKLHNAKITASGMDFIADDGGLSAILGVVTVKLHEDTLKALLVEKIQKSDAPQSVKDKLIERLKSIPSEALGKLTQRALDAGLDHVQDLPAMLDKWLSP